MSFVTELEPEDLMKSEIWKAYKFYGSVSFLLSDEVGARSKYALKAAKVGSSAGTHALVRFLGVKERFGKGCIAACALRACPFRVHSRTRRRRSSELKTQDRKSVV